MNNSNEILIKALKNKYAVAQFNINNLEWTKYILEECEKNKAPVILGVSEGAIKYMGGYNVVSNIVKSLIKDLNITIPVVLHLDHGSSIESCKKAIDAGFTSVMIDASKYELSKNIEIVKETHIDTLAPALGSVHGLYKGKPNLNYTRMKEISEKLNIPLVLHGGTGIPDEDILKAIENGINKININTELQLAWNKGVRKYIKENEDVYDPRKIISAGESNIKKCIEDKLHLLRSSNRIG